MTTQNAIQKLTAILATALDAIVMIEEQQKNGAISVPSVVADKIQTSKDCLEDIKVSIKY